MFPFEHQGKARLTFAFVAASSFSSHAFSTVVSASIAFQFFSRRSCGDHTERAISHTPCKGPQSCLLALQGISKPLPRELGLVRSPPSHAHMHSFLPHLSSGPTRPIALAVPWREQGTAGQGRSSRSRLRMPAGDTGQVQGCRVASTHLTSPCSRGIRSRGAGRCEGACSGIALALPG